MSTPAVTADQVLSLPQGGGAVAGLGETFHPDLHTGTGAYRIPLDIPNGPNATAPRLGLTYHTGAGNGPFGVGFSLCLPAIARSTNKRLPTYTLDEPLVLAGSGELLPVEGGYRLANDPHSWIVEHCGEGFRLTDRSGTHYFLGITAQARLTGEVDGKAVTLSWHLEAIEDALVNRASFSYLRDGGQLYLSRLEYSIYALSFQYKPGRPDVLTDCRGRFVVTTRLRCTAIELSITAEAGPPVRRWELAYDPEAPSRLTKVTLTGWDAIGKSAQAPVLRLGYTQAAAPQLHEWHGVAADPLPGPPGSGNRELVDWNGDGLPDLVALGPGPARVWPNRGDATWGPATPLPALPVPAYLDDPGVAFVDMEGNGTADLVVLGRPLSGYYPHRPGGGFDAPVFWSHPPPSTWAIRPRGSSTWMATAWQTCWTAATSTGCSTIAIRQAAGAPRRK